MIPKVGLHNEAMREAWLEQALKQIRPGSRILDAGAGELKYRKFCSHLDYVSQDFARYDGTGDSQGLQMGSWDQSQLDIVCDITSIPELDGSFDAIMCVEVFEHLPNPLLALKEFTRLLKAGGQLIVTAPFCSLTHFSPYHYYSGFSRNFYATHLPAHSYVIVDLQENGNFFEFLAQEVRRVPFVAKRYANSHPGLWSYSVLYLMLRVLDSYSRKDRSSSEILHFGCFVRAVKQGISTG